MNDQIIDEIFSPYAPINDVNFCYGRKKEINLIEQSVKDKGKHIIVFGERGIGKTSLINIACGNKFKILKISIVCSQLINHPNKIWEEVLEKILNNIENFSKFNKLKPLIPLIEKYLLKKKFKLNQLIFFFSQLNYPILIVMDEVDLLTNEKSNLISLAETIKAFSDHIPTLTLLLIGIANNASELVAQHISLERCLIEIKLKRMNFDKQKDILEGGLIKVKMNMMEDVKEAIINFSEGLPFYIHLLAVETLKHAQQLKYKTAVKSNFRFAKKKIIEDRYHSLDNNYHKAISYSKNEFYEKVLVACIDFLQNYNHDNKIKQFQVKDILPYLIKKNGKCNERTVQNYLNKICEFNKGEIMLKKTLPTGVHYTFKNPLIKTFICDMIRA